jgi:hypothetical protein
VNVYKLEYLFGEWLELFKGVEQGPESVCFLRYDLGAFQRFFIQGVFGGAARLLCR